MAWKKYKSIIIFLFLYVILRVVLLNINVTEWGDSFRILRAAQYILHFSYPLDEKRLPFFSAILAPGLLFLEPVLWGRIYSIIAAVANLILTAVLYRTLFPKVKTNTLILVSAFLAFNQIFFYWSLRISAETTFTALILLSFIIWFRRGGPCALPQSSEGGRNLAVAHKGPPYEFWLGLILALASLTRYEGFLLAGAFGIYFLIKRQWTTIVRVFIPWVVLVIPWFILTKLVLKGPTSDAYVSELSTFKFDLQRFGYFLTYGLFFLGFPPLIGLLIPDLKSLIVKARRNVRSLFLSVYSPLLLFLIFEFALFFIWTPSLPRIMVSIIPLVVILLTNKIDIVMGLMSESTQWQRKTALISVVSLILFVGLQAKFKLYFLVLSRTGLAIIIFLSLMAIIAMWVRSKKLFVTSALLSMLVGCLVVVANQRLVYSTIYRAAVYALTLPGKIAYSDETGVSAWYLGVKGVYYPQTGSVDQAKWLQENQISYVLDTNEFNRGSKLTVTGLSCRPRFGVVIADILDYGGLYKAGLLGDKPYPLLYTDICKV